MNQTNKETPFKFLLISAEFPPQIGGIASLTSGIAHGLDGKKHGGRRIDVRVLTSVGGGEEFSFPVTRTPGFLNYKFLKLIPLLIATIWICWKDRPDKILLGKWTHEGPVALIVGIMFAIPYVTLVHGSEIMKFSGKRILGPLARRILSAGERVIAVSNYTKNLVTDLGVSEDKVTIIHNGINLSEYRVDASGVSVKEKWELENKTVLITVSRLVKRKGHDRVLEALSEITGNFPDLIYLIAGDGEYRDALEEQAASLGIRDSVKFLGFVKKGKLEEFYAASDIFVMPNRVEEEAGDVEGFGLSFLEANLFGLPVIGGRSGGATDAIIDGETGFLVDPGQVSEVREKLVQLIENENLRERLGVQGRKRVMSDLNSKSQTDKYAEVLLGER